MMKCPNCGAEMENGYSLQLGFGGIIRVVRKPDSLTSGRIDVSVCPDCGKIESYVDVKSIK